MSNNLLFDESTEEVVVEDTRSTLDLLKEIDKTSLTIGLESLQGARDERQVLDGENGSLTLQKTLDAMGDRETISKEEYTAYLSAISHTARELDFNLESLSLPSIDTDQTSINTEGVTSAVVNFLGTIKVAIGTTYRRMARNLIKYIIGLRKRDIALKSYIARMRLKIESVDKRATRSKEQFIPGNSDLSKRFLKSMGRVFARNKDPIVVMKTFGELRKATADIVENASKIPEAYASVKADGTGATLNKLLSLQGALLSPLDKVPNLKRTSPEGTKLYVLPELGEDDALHIYIATDGKLLVGDEEDVISKMMPTNKEVKAAGIRQGVFSYNFRASIAAGMSGFDSKKYSIPVLTRGEALKAIESVEAIVATPLNADNLTTVLKSMEKDVHRLLKDSRSEDAGKETIKRIKAFYKNTNRLTKLIFGLVLDTSVTTVNATEVLMTYINKSVAEWEVPSSEDENVMVPAEVFNTEEFTAMDKILLVD